MLLRAEDGRNPEGEGGWEGTVLCLQTSHNNKKKQCLFMFSQGQGRGKWDECESSARGPGVNKQTVALELRNPELLRCNVIYFDRVQECVCVR